MHALETIDRISPTRRPARTPIGRHVWSNLLFAHWPVPVEDLAPLVPPRLTIDTFNGTAWIALVPFTLSEVRPWWSPAVPGISAFHETNVRTYVHLDGRDPGVWFFSLDASSSLAVRIARALWNLNYYRATMELSRTESLVRYRSRRHWPGVSGYGADVEVEIGPPYDASTPGVPRGTAAPDTLEHFFCERYVLYAARNDGTLFQGRVYHSPYPLRTCEVTHLEDSLIQAAGVTVEGPPAHAIFSERVAVDIYPLVRV
ncbi:MAG: YqjF family protein [Planctomycetaceae bacterium]